MRMLRVISHMLSPILFLALQAAAPQGLTLYDPIRTPDAWLIDTEGQVVHHWKGTGQAGHESMLLDDGHLLRAVKVGNKVFRGGGEGGRLEKLNPQSEVVWFYELSNEKNLHHHDFEVLPNGNILLIAWEKKTPEESIAAGRDAEAVGNEGQWPDCLIEIRPQETSGAEVVWEWHAWDHIVQDRDPEKPNYGQIHDHPERVNINWGGVDRRPGKVIDAENEKLKALGYLDEEEEDVARPPMPNNKGRGGPHLKGDWMHTNAVAYEPNRDLIAISVRSFHEIWVIDHSTTTQEASGHSGGKHGKGGDLLYRWGNPQTYGMGERQDQTLFGQHDVRWIPQGQKGAGDLTVFNNGEGRPGGTFSSVDQFTPPWNDDGGFHRETNSSFGPNKAHWSYSSSPKKEFFSGHISGAERLENGNTLVASGEQGLIFEVTARGEQVWKYQVPKEHQGVRRKEDRGGRGGPPPGFGPPPGDGPPPGYGPPPGDGPPRQGPRGRRAGGLDGGLWRAHRYASNHPGVEVLRNTEGATAPSSSSPNAPVATSSPWKYHNLQLQGWTIHVEDKLFEQKELKEDVLALLRNELWEIRTRLPQAVVQRLQKVKMRFHLNRTECPGGVYHPSPVWLSEHGLPPDWAEGIEFGVAKNFLTWSRTQPDMVLHELSHAWHHQVLGYEHEGIRKAFDAAVKSGSLERVPYVHGGERRAYARNNPQEFFAEMSEAWWGVNDFYPFVHAEVLASFPEVGNLMGQVWALPQ